MTQDWPIRYRCRKCSRSTSSYPFGCDTPECPIKIDMKKDIKWDIFYGIPLSIFFILLCFFSVYMFFYVFSHL